MGCGATKLQSRVIQPAGYHLPQSQVEVTNDGVYDHEQQVTRCAEEQESFQSQESCEKRQVVENQQEHVNKQQVNNQQDIPRAGSISDEQDEVTRHQTDELNVNQDLCDYEVSKTSSKLQDNTGDTIVPVCAAIVDTQHNEMSCNNGLLTSPQQYCATARSLSRSPRIVSLQVELGFVNVTTADLDLLQSKCNGKCDIPD